MRFDTLIGQNIQAAIPFINKTEFQDIKIHGVETGGLWIECQALTNQILEAIGESHGRTPLFFLPFHQISFAWTAIDQIALSESALGVSPRD